MQLRGWKISLAIAGLVAAGTFSTMGLAAKDDAARAPRPALTVETVKPAHDKWPLVVTANGSIAPWQEAVIGAETGGLRITELFVDVGSVVHKGDKLAQLAQDSVAADLAVQKAHVAQAKAQLEEAKANADRARNLETSSAMSAQQINQYLIGQQTAEANLAATEAQLKSQQIRMAQTTIVAVDDGVISSRSATLGAVVQVGTELFRMVRQNRLEWRAEVVAEQLPGIRTGQRVRVQLTNGETVDGAVRVAAPTFDSNTRKTIVYVDLAASKTARAGMFASGDILVGNNSVLTVPEPAVVLRDGFSYVFVVKPDSKVEQRKVVTGRRAHSRGEISEGIADGDTLVATGGAFLNDGDLVRVLQSGTEKDSK